MNIVYNMDCMKYMKNIPDKYFERAIVDPPYGIQKGNLIRFKKKSIQHEQSIKCKIWDKRPQKEYFNELFRISKHQIIWGMQYFISDLHDCSQIIVWNKLTKNNIFADGELAWCSIKGTCRIFTHQWNGCFKDSEKNIKAIHVNQKPIALYKWLLKKYAKPGDKIFDSHVGSGSIRIACHELGFNFTGCELDKDYYEAQEKRFFEFKKNFNNEFYIDEKEMDLFNYEK
jgi:site-specific DNA-methyltransferase (adenine-specific)